jgi:hypothetical protein
MIKMYNWLTANFYNYTKLYRMFYWQIPAVGSYVFIPANGFSIGLLGV